MHDIQSPEASRRGYLFYRSLWLYFVLYLCCVIYMKKLFSFTTLLLKFPTTCHEGFFYKKAFFFLLFSPSSRSTMLPANILLLMFLLLPQVSSGRQGEDTSEIDHGRVPSTSSSSTPTPSMADSNLSQTIQNLLLSRLGLQSMPNPQSGVPVPQYLLDLYRFHQKQYHLVEDPSFSFPSQHIQQANTVRSFHHRGKVSAAAVMILGCLGKCIMVSIYLTVQK